MAIHPRSVSFRAVRFTGGHPVRLADGSYSVQTVTHHWCPCDRCGVAALLPAGGLNASWACPACRRRSTRKSEGDPPVCQGRVAKGEQIVHGPVAMVSDDPTPGRPCRMTPGCRGRHRMFDSSERNHG